MPLTLTTDRRPLLLAAAVSAALAIAAAPWALAQPWLLWLFKPATTVLLLAWAAGRGQGHPMRRPLLLGLLASLGGDVALLWPQQGFLPGLVCFLVAHLAYCVALWRGGARPWWPAWLACAAVAAAVLGWLWPGVPVPLRGPVLVYVGALGVMVALALARGWHQREPGAVAAALGAALFMASDATLAADRFAAPVPQAGLWILGSYWLAQALIAAALPRRAAGTA